MKRCFVPVIAILLTILGSCAKQESREASETQAAPRAPAAAAVTAAPASAPVANRAPALPRKLVRTVDLELEVKSPEEAAAKVQALAAGLGGYVASASTRRQNDVLQYTLT